MSEAENKSDAWSQWVLSHRHAGDEAYQRVVRQMIERIRDRVLDGCRLEPEMTLADIGTGDGLIAFGAIERVGSSLRAILTDISQPLLDHARDTATQAGIAAQCSFIRCSAEKLQGIGDASIDVACTRAVLAYVPDKPAAFGELFRVLKAGGRLSIAEPIFRDRALEALALTKAIGGASAPGAISFPHLLHKWKSAQFPSTEDEIGQSPIANFNERDLFRLAQGAGFSEIHLELHIDQRASSIKTWEVFVGTAPHPLAPSLKEILATQFSASERMVFERVMRPQVESGQMLETDAIAYLTAVKPAA